MKPQVVAPLILAGVGCFGSTELLSPDAPPDAQAVFFVRTCGPSVSLSAHLPNEPLPVFAESCAQPAEYFLVYSAESLQSFRLEPGPLIAEGCPPEFEPCCVDVPLPRAQRGML